MSKKLLIGTTAVLFFLGGTGLFYLSSIIFLGEEGFGRFMAILAYSTFCGQLACFGIDNRNLLTIISSGFNSTKIFTFYLLKLIKPLSLTLIISIYFAVKFFNYNDSSSLFLITVLIAYLPLSSLIQTQYLAANRRNFKLVWFAIQPWIKSLAIILCLYFLNQNIETMDFKINYLKSLMAIILLMTIFIAIVFTFISFTKLFPATTNTEVESHESKYNQTLYFALDHINFHSVLSLTLPVSSLVLSNYNTSQFAFAYSLYTFPYLLFFMLWQQLYHKQITKLLVNGRIYYASKLTAKIKNNIIAPLTFIFMVGSFFILPRILSSFNIEFHSFKLILLLLSISIFPSLLLVQQNTIINSLGLIRQKSIIAAFLTVIYFVSLPIVAKYYSSGGIAIVHSLFIILRFLIFNQLIIRYRKMHVVLV